MMTGQGTHSFPEQDHKSHLAIHMNGLQQIIGSGDQQVIAQIAPIFQAHMAEHVAQQYALEISQQLAAKTGIPLPGIDLQDPEQMANLPIDIENAIAQYQVLPPPPQPPDQGPDQDQQAFEADQKRKDIANAADIKRKDDQHVAELRRKGLISDVGNGAPAGQP
jgi:type III secretory pathway component EscV